MEIQEPQEAGTGEEGQLGKKPKRTKKGYWPMGDIIVQTDRCPLCGEELKIAEVVSRKNPATGRDELVHKKCLEGESQQVRNKSY
jgi:hypothetical protein